MAPTLSGPRRSRSTRSASSACSTVATSGPGPTRVVNRSRMFASCNRRNANASARDDESSNHWRSSTATRTGSASVSSCSELRTAIPSAAGSTPSGAASVRSSATSSARRLGGGSSGSSWSTTSSRRSASPAWASPHSASAGREQRTRNPCARACSTPSDQSVDFPMPASPSSTRTALPRRASPTKARTRASSSSLLTISGAMLLATIVTEPVGNANELWAWSTTSAPHRAAPAPRDARRI